MSIIKAGKVQSGISLNLDNNFILDASADDGTLNIKRESGAVILSADATGIVDIAGSGQVFGKSNILGEVSQLNGVPTGAVIESGYNANGEYMKFADSSMFCWKAIPTLGTGRTAYGTSLYQSTAVTWTYPCAFVNTPSISGGAVDSSFVAIVGILTPSTTSVGIKNISPGSTAAGTVYAMAIGRWF